MVGNGTFPFSIDLKILAMLFTSGVFIKIKQNSLKYRSSVERL